MWLTSVFDSMQVVFPREPLSQFCHTEASLLSFRLEPWAPEVPLSSDLVPAGGQRGLQAGTQAAAWAWDRPALLYYKALTNRVVIIISVSTSQPIGHSGDKEVDPEPELSLCQFIAAGRFIPTPVSPATFPCRPSLLPPFVLKPAERSIPFSY